MHGQGKENKWKKGLYREHMFGYINKMVQAEQNVYWKMECEKVRLKGLMQRAEG